MRLAVAGTHALLLVGTAACAAGADPDPTPADVATYVALGDSYSAAAGVPVTEHESGCERSTGSYPARVAKELGVTTYVDVTCGGASTRNLLESQQALRGPVPAQLDAVTRDADLVTLGIGVNDGIFAGVFGTCLMVAPGDPDGAPCQKAMTTPDGGDRLDGILESIRTRLDSALREVEKRAPDAEVVLVGYPQLVPPEGYCPGLPLAHGDYEYVRELMVDLGGLMEEAADSAGVHYVDLLEPSEGHDICAGDEAWVNGVVTDPERATGLHPFAEEQQAVADLVVEALAAD